MSQTIAVPKDEFKELVSSVKRIELLLSALVEEDEAKQHKDNYQYEEGEPEYGSENWWKWADKKGLDAVKKGKTKNFTSEKELLSHLDLLK